MQATTALFFLAVGYNDAVGAIAMALSYYVVIMAIIMFIHLANVKGRQVSCSLSAQPSEGA